MQKPIKQRQSYFGEQDQNPSTILNINRKSKKIKKDGKWRYQNVSKDKNKKLKWTYTKNLTEYDKRLKK